MKPAVTLKQASPGDLEEVMKIENTCFGADAFSRWQIAYLMTRAKGLFLVAEHNGVTAGYLSFIISRRHHTGRIYSIAVAPGYRGLGIADILMDKTIACANEKNLQAVFLEVRTDNTAAIRLYEKKRFITRAVKHNYYNGGVSAYRMALSLQTQPERGK
ncbi:MAG: ribosomal protein S18-alanine N-acetyltransferase [Tannerella sp.]|jgi:ribosomal-protein-alanine acetyltransferase|nr:ribosomal protein S18-alanine N-acetyltransferase [Tannerella sp.]